MKRRWGKLFSAFSALSFAWAVWFFWPPDVRALKTFNPARTRLMEIRMIQAKAAGRSYKIRQTWVPLERISPHLRHAILVSEDARFYEHGGVDWDAVMYSVRQDIRRRKFAFGGSTITQQVAKNLFLTPRKSPFRKIKEIEIAFLMERSLSKRRIMEIYLNVIEWGNGIFGAEAAAQAFFGKAAADLSPEEAASLAAVVPSPRRHSPTGNSAFTARRRVWVLKWMGRSGFLPVLETNEALGFSPPAELLNERIAEPEAGEEEGVELTAPAAGTDEPEISSEPEELAPDPDASPISIPVK